jgi:hypothetical protein
MQALGEVALPMSDELQAAWKTVALNALARTEEWVREYAGRAIAAFDAGYGLSDEEIEQYPLLSLI